MCEKPNISRLVRKGRSIEAKISPTLSEIRAFCSFCNLKMVKRKSMELSPMISPLRIVAVSHKKAEKKETPSKDHVEANSTTIKRAEKFRLCLGSEFPSFVKSLSQSHVSGACMKICLPAKFCRLYLVGKDRVVTLVDESGREFKASYVVKRFEVGWMRFSRANNLCAGDVVVFQLIENFKFKLYIVRDKDAPQTDIPTSGGSSGSSQSENDSEEDSCNLDSEDSYGSDNEGSGDSDSEDSWKMVISGYTKKIERKNPKRSKFLPGSDVIERAKKIKADLPAEFPSCIRPYSQLCHDRQYLRLPRKFCRKNLKDDGAVKDVILVGEDDGKEYEMKFINDWKELNCGWSAFSKCNNLRVGDVLVFCLIGHFRFKVYIVRDIELVGAEEAGRALVCAAVSDPDPQPSETDQNASEEGAGSSSETTTLPSSFEEFSIVVNGMTLDSKIPERTRRKYYDLCCSQNTCLHRRLLEHVDTEGWVNAIISKVVDIAEDIRSCTPRLPLVFYKSRVSILESFEKLGMNVGFLRDRLDRLREMAFGPEMSEVARIRESAVQELMGVEERARGLELELVKLRRRREDLVMEIEEWKIVCESHECRFMEMAGAAW